MANSPRGAHSRPLLAIWLVAFGITISTWLLVYAQIRAEYQQAAGSAFPYHYVTFAVILTSVFICATGVVHTFVAKLIAREAAMRRLAGEMQHLAEKDLLTDLPNRNFFMARLERHMHKCAAGALSLIFIDIDNFKNINDSLGHNYGDELLKNVARRLRGRAGVGAMLARIGGDEFAILVEDEDSACHAERIAKGLVEEFRIAFGLRGDSYVVSLSIGIATWSDASATASELLTNADLAMYAAKSGQRLDGESSYRSFNDEIATRALRDIERQQELQYAIRDREFVVDYKGIVESRTQHVVGVEALIKWMHPERGLIPAEEFMPFADETGFGSKIAGIAIETALRQYKVWYGRADAPHFLSIKVTESQVMQNSFVAAIVHLLGIYEMAPAQLRFEISETDLQRGGDALKSKLDEIRERGISLTVCEFGGRVGALDVFRGRFSGIKIDRSLLNSVHQIYSCDVIFEGIVSIARRLGFSIIVDGVDASGQLAWLERYKDIDVQGAVVPAVPAIPLGLVQ